MSKNVKKFLQLETVHTSTGTLPVDQGVDVEAFRVRVENSDLRHAEALAQTSPEMDDFQKIRTLLRRGDLSGAQSLLENLAAFAENSETFVEIYLEQTRLAAFEARWDLALHISQQALALQPTGVSRMALHQVRALAFFELADFAKAQREVDLATSLTKLFPKGGLALYVEATQIKILIHQNQLPMAAQKLTRAWKQLIASSDLNADNVLTLLRVELELRRFEGKSYETLAFATWFFAQAIGDQLYADLAALDLYFLDPREDSAWRQEIGFALERYERIRKIFAEASTIPLTSSAKSLIKQNRKVSVRASDAEKFDQVFLLHHGLVFDKASLKVKKRALTGQMKNALTVLSRGPFTKEAFFRHLWGDQKFVFDLHDTVIRSLLHRLRKSMAVDVRTQELLIEVRGTLLVDE